MDKDKEGYIRYLRLQENISISEIARRVKVDRKTVRRVLCALKKKDPKQRESKLDEYKEKISRLLEEKPYISNVLIFEAIKKNGYRGGRSILGDYLLQLRSKSKEAFNHLESLPGAQAQVDWAYCGSISCGAHQRRLYLFCMVLSYSRYMYITFTTSMDSDIFMACHIKAFRYFGGVPKSLLYDNLKSVVSHRYGREVVLNERFLDFALHYGFKVKVCNVRRGNEKGKVERAIRYVKSNFIKRDEYQNLTAIETEAKCWLKETANCRIHSVTRKQPLETFTNEETSFLLPLPGNDYDYAKATPLKVRKDCLFTFDTNRYSIPAEYFGQPLFFKAYTDSIKILKNDKIIASHTRCYDKYQTIKNPEHYAQLTALKKKAQYNLDIERFKSLSPEAADYFSGLMKNQLNALYHVRQILSLEKLFGKVAVAEAMAHALAYKAFHWEFIKNILLNSKPSLKTPQSALYDREQLMNIRVKAPDLSDYDQLKDKEEAGQ